MSSMVVSSPPRGPSLVMAPFRPSKWHDNIPSNPSWQHAGTSAGAEIPGEGCSEPTAVVLIDRH